MVSVIHQYLVSASVGITLALGRAFPSVFRTLTIFAVCFFTAAGFHPCLLIRLSLFKDITKTQAIGIGATC